MHAVPKMGPPGGPIFWGVRFIFVKFFASELKKRNVLVSTGPLAYGDRKGNYFSYFFFILLFFLKFWTNEKRKQK